MAITETTFVMSGVAARIVGVNVATLKGYVRSGKLNATRTETGTLLFRREDLEAFVQSRKRKSTEAA